jgi:hypothetical protein
LLTVEDLYEPLAKDTIGVVMECMSSEEWSARKVAVDLIYTMAVIL